MEISKDKISIEGGLLLILGTLGEMLKLSYAAYGLRGDLFSFPFAPALELHSFITAPPGSKSEMITTSLMILLSDFISINALEAAMQKSG